MKSTLPICLSLMLIANTALAQSSPADVPSAGRVIRVQYIKEYSPACIKAIEDNAELKTLYSHKTVEVYCNCRQTYRADVITQAAKDGRRGKPVQDEAADYAEKKCTPILINQVEHE